MLVFGSVLLICFVLQYRSGAFASALGAQPDEAAHYVTGLMIRDYLLHGLPKSPRVFAENFYLHYPRVAFGLWPPLFHLASAIWMAIFGAGRAVILSLLAVIGAVWCFAFYRLMKPLTGFPLAFLCALFLASLPATQKSTHTVMMDSLLAVFALGAMACYGRFLNQESWRNALGFGLFSSAAILTKYNGLELALVPPICVLLTGRYYLLRSRLFWLPLAVVVILAGPWYIAMLPWVLYAMEPGDAGFSLWPNFLASCREVISLTGPVVTALGALGAFLLIRNRSSLSLPFLRNTETDGLHISAFAVFIATWLFHTAAYPLIESRYLLPVAPALIVLAIFAVRSLEIKLCFNRERRWLDAMAVAVVTGLYLLLTFTIPQKRATAYTEVADFLFSAAQLQNRVVLVSSDASGEGMAVSEVAMRDHRPQHIVVRASKLLAQRRLMGQGYSLLYHSPREVMQALRASTIKLIVLDDCSTLQCGEHHSLLSETIQQFPNAWRLARTIPVDKARAIRIYSRLEMPEFGNGSIRLDMKPTLGRDITGSTTP